MISLVVLVVIRMNVTEESIKKVLKEKKWMSLITRKIKVSPHTMMIRTKKNTVIKETILNLRYGFFLSNTLE